MVTYLCLQLLDVTQTILTSLVYTIRKAQEDKQGLEQNGTHQLLVCLHDDINLHDENINVIKKNTETLLDASKEIGLEGN